MPTPKIIYQFKITLLDTDPAIWRRIQVPETYTFWDLHVAIQCAMGWEDCHLHMFRIGRRGEIIIKGSPFDDDWGHRDNYNGWEVEVGYLLQTPGDVALYEYDFGDSWEHEVLLEGIFLKEKGIKYPRCIDGARACPPEDCGGIWGYANLLEILASPQHPEHEDMKDWIGGKYEAEKFDLESVKFANPKTRWKRFQE